MLGYDILQYAVRTHAADNKSDIKGYKLCISPRNNGGYAAFIDKHKSLQRKWRITIFYSEISSNTYLKKLLKE